MISGEKSESSKTEAGPGNQGFGVERERGVERVETVVLLNAKRSKSLRKTIPNNRWRMRTK